MGVSAVPGAATIAAPAGAAYMVFVSTPESMPSGESFSISSLTDETALEGSSPLGKETIKRARNEIEEGGDWDRGRRKRHKECTSAVQADDVLESVE